MNPPMSAAGSQNASIDQDTPCPHCQYNLRGLTVPRCPECGFQFHWKDLASFRAAHLMGRRFLWRRYLVALLLVVAGLLFLVAPVLLFSVAAFVTVSFLALAGLGVLVVLAVFQTVVEMLIALPVLGPPPPRRFRTWFEASIIGNIFSILFLASQLHAPGLSEIINQPWPPTLALLHLMSGLIALSAYLHFFTYRFRARQWNEPIPTNRLILAAVTAKTVTILFIVGLLTLWQLSS